MGTHWLVMNTSGEGAAAPFSARVAGAGRHYRQPIS
jgi:3-oxoacyl-[acyl-carrier-protein] synthase III